MERFHLIRGIFGGSDVYDNAGNKVGYSLPSIVGDGEDFYDNDGNYVGQSYESAFGGEAFSGGGAYGYMDDEILMGRNAWMHGDPFKKEQAEEADSFTVDFERDEGTTENYFSDRDYFDAASDGFDFDVGSDDW